MNLTHETIARVLFADRARVLAYIWSIVRDQTVTEDIFQDVVVAALQKSDDITSADHLLQWARQAARFRSIDYLRRHRRFPLQLDDDVLDLLDVAWHRRDEVSSQVQLEMLRRCLDELAPKARQIVDLRYQRELSCAEVAEHVGQTVGSLYTTMSRIYRTLSDCVARRIASEGAAR
jgi:RNA polymerase sigma-70 factor (ECF subfamily)